VLSQNNVIMTCACGRSGGHRGWCRVRLLTSERRRKFLQSWHQDLIDGGIIEVPEEQPKALITLEPLVVRRAQRAPELPNVGLPKFQPARQF
jgi:hypothetical protein